MTDDDELNVQLAANSMDDVLANKASSPDVVGEMASPPQSKDQARSMEYRQWVVEPNDVFRPAGLTQDTLPSGVFTVEKDDYGLYFRRIKVLTDDLIRLPDTANDRVLVGMRKFWQRRKKYAEYGLLYKRGVLLWGPPGGGKTATVTMLSRELLDEGGIVVLCEHPGLTARGLSHLRRIEPARPLVCIEEDIDEMVNRHGEHELLALLDGENQVDNIVHVATTNYPERLGARIVNRPSRFDERIKIGMPTQEARLVYLRHTAISLGDSEVRRWVDDTEGFSIAHLRELTAAVLCLDQPYQEVIDRLRSMKWRLRGDEGLGGTKGFLRESEPQKEYALQGQQVPATTRGY